MARLIGIDYGRKRVGIAVTDPMQMIATGLTTVRSMDAITFLTDYLKKEEVEGFVIGDPKNLDNTPTEATVFVNKFVQELERYFPEIPVTRIDERFTTKIAKQTILMSGAKKKKRQNKPLIDKISAIIILQSFLSMQ